MAELQVTGQAELVKLLAKKDTWTPPVKLAEYMGLMLKMVAVNRYRNMYEELDARDLYSMIRVKLSRAMADGKLDVNELVKAGAAAGLLYIRVSSNKKSDSGPILTKGGQLISVGDKSAETQVNGLGKKYASSPPTPPKPTENTEFLKGWKCPKCGSLGSYKIFNSRCDADVTDKGVLFTALTLNPALKCQCNSCYFTGRVYSFRPKKTKAKGKK